MLNPFSSQQGKKNDAPGAISYPSRNLCNARGHAFKPAQGSESIRSSDGVKGAVECGSSQRADTGRACALGIHYFSIQSLVAQAGQATLDVQVAAFGLKVLLCFYAGLHCQGNRCAGSQRQTRSHHGKRLVSDGRKRCTGAAHQLHKVDGNVNVLVVALAGQVKPVTVVGVEDQVITHGFAFVWPRRLQSLKIFEAVEVQGAAGTVALGCAAPASQKLSLWASRKSDIESVETFNVAQPWMPATCSKGGAA